MEKDEVKISFLDILLYKEGQKLHTDIFYKKKDTHQYLNFNSCHRRHTKENIPFTLARRICCIVSKPEIRNERLRELEGFLQKQNYPKKLISKGIKKAKSLTLTELRQTKDKSNKETALPLVITHNPKNPQIVARLKQDLKFLNNSARMKSILDKKNLIVSRRQPKNLKQYLTNAKFTSVISELKTVNQCKEARCGTCDIIITGHNITFKNGKKWEIKSSMSCKSRNVIYVIICVECNSFYVGQTEYLRNRVTLHREQINHERYRHLAVSEHLAQCSKGKFKIMPIYQCENMNRLFRESKEQNIINILQPDLNSRR